jgi:hypothetical protein
MARRLCTIRSTFSAAEMLPADTGAFEIYDDGEVREMRNATTCIGDHSPRALECRIPGNRVTSGGADGKASVADTSAAAYLTSRSVLREHRGAIPSDEMPTQVAYTVNVNASVREVPALVISRERVVVAALEDDLRSAARSGLIDDHVWQCSRWVSTVGHIDADVADHMPSARHTIIEQYVST